jgi:hypothetical protein
VSDTVTLHEAGQKEATFNFNPPLDVNIDLCASGNEVFFSVHKVTFFTASYIFLYGSETDVYVDGRAIYLHGGGSVGLSDLYFIINKNAVTNLAPTLNVIENQFTSEDSELVFTTVATDPDADPLTYSVTNLPTGATYNATTGEFSWTPDYDDASTYEVTFTVSDGSLTDSETVTIEVTNTNRPPVLASIGNQTVTENQNLTFILSATDPDGDTLTYSALNLPTGSTFNPTTRVFSWTPTYAQSGNYENIEFTVSDNGSPMELAVELITITVGNINRSPELTNPGPQQILEEELLSFNTTASDPDGDSVSLSASGVPSGATFNTTTGSFTWTPTLTEEGIYTVTITATDNGSPVETSALDVVITVGDNPTPVEQAEDLITLVTDFSLPTSFENAYMANLQKVGTFIEAGNIQAAINQLNAFINKVNQNYAQGKITLVQRNAMVAAAQSLISEI